ncbi:beta-N-acetylhexosaminidase [Silvimonas terrae]|uniref:beta-N-acetylhexosaminidase n=1 Tax=Silvimonas terrae TaxID=300266 RepID=A0A840REW4_9NEIS|nr:beta-N-acetylhexosaminidase [Silvimonas terrae]MBB5191058.1 beta-N-acetylhexosaminidase [Silvimonas terrae]
MKKWRDGSNLTPFFVSASSLVSHAMNLSLKRKIGQLLMVGFDGLTPNAHIEHMLRERQVGGVILFRRNVDHPAQIAALTRRLQEINAEHSHLPLMISIDQEGGMVARIENGVTPLPSALAYRAAGSVADCETLTRYANEELRLLGFNVNFVPDVDVNNNRRNPVIGVRAFGETVDEVTTWSLAALRGVQAAGMISAAKHFPGHGDTDVDSHLGLPRVPHNRARLDQVELAPFRAAIAAGVDTVMSSHVVFPAFEPDPDTPATMSRAVLTGLLREEMGFNGVLFTDCLEMDAIAKGPGTVAGAVAAFKAGADVLLISHTQARQEGFLDALADAVSRGEISESRIDASLARILALKSRYPLAWRDLPLDPTPLLAQPAALALSQSVHQRAVTVAGELHPLQPQQPVLLITVEVRERTEIDEVQARPDTLAAPLSAAGFMVEEIRIPLAVTEADRARVLDKAATAAQVVMVSYNAILQQAQQALIAALPAEKLWLVAGRLPYDLDLAPAALGRLTVFANRPAALAAIAARLQAG